MENDLQNEIRSETMHKEIADELGFVARAFTIGVKKVKGAESNCSRLARLCWKYRVPPTLFFNNYLKLGKPVTRSFFKFEVASHLNSHTDKTLEYQRRLNELTGERLDRLFSYSYLHPALDGRARGMLCTTKQWCRVCYLKRFVDGEHENGIYDDLYWSIDSIKHCLLHGVELEKKCSRCMHFQPYISTLIEPGYCHYCQHFLGKGHSVKVSDEVLETLNETFTLFYLDTFEGVRPSLFSLVDNLKALKRAYPEASNKYLGDLMGVSEDVVKKWMQGKRKPQLTTLYLLYRGLGLYGPHQLFYPPDIFMSKVILSKALSLRFNTRSEFAGMVKTKEIIDSFESMISGLEPTVSRSEFAKRHEVTDGYLMSSYSAFCERLTRAHADRLSDLREKRKVDLIEQLAIALGKVRSRKKKWNIYNAVAHLEDPSIVDEFSEDELFIPLEKAKLRLREMDASRKKSRRRWSE